ncbi:MAG: hypothetical protein ACI9YL_001803 [Luteibaculaceae bacterium]|jgi:hypothetical protein
MEYSIGAFFLPRPNGSTKSSPTEARQPDLSHGSTPTAIPATLTELRLPRYSPRVILEPCPNLPPQTLTSILSPQTSHPNLPPQTPIFPLTINHHPKLPPQYSLLFHSPLNTPNSKLSPQYSHLFHSLLFHSPLNTPHTKPPFPHFLFLFLHQPIVQHNQHHEGFSIP